MERLIDATRIEQYILNNCSDNEEINAIYAEIINAPTVDAVPVVRCKDCRYYDDTQWCEWVTRYITSDCFCAWGEKREDKRLVMPPADGSTIPQEYWAERREDDRKV